MIASPEAYAHALSAAFLADMDRLPQIRVAMAERRYGPARLRDMILGDLQREASGRAEPVVFPALRAFLRATMDVEEARISGRGLGQWAELANTVLAAASKFGSLAIEGGAAKAIAEAEVKKQRLALKAAELEAARARMAYAAAEGAPGAAAGLPSWAPYAAGAIAILGLGYIILTRR